MSLDRPSFPNEAEIPQTALTLTSAGCANPGFAIDDDPATAAAFAAPGSLILSGASNWAAPIDAAAQGTMDWMVLGLSRMPGANLLAVASGTNYGTGNPHPAVAWEGGTGVAPSGSDTTQRGLIPNGQYGSVLTAPCGPQPRRLTIYAPAGGSPQGAIDYYAAFSDGIARHVGQSGLTDQAFVIDYYSPVPGDTLTISATSVTGTGANPIIAAVTLAPSPNTLPARFLRVTFDYDRFVSRVRILQSGPGALNAGLDYETGLVPVNPPDVALAQIPLPVGPDPPGSDSQGVYDLVYDPPVYAAGIVFFPDAAAPAPLVYPSVSLYHLQIYESVPEGVSPMANATVERVRVGCQLITIFPWVPGQSAAQYLASNTGVNLHGIKELGQSTTIKLARLTGGESAKQLGGWETDNDTKIKPTFAKSTMQAIAILRGDSFTVDAANGNLPEVQYMRGVKANRASYFFCYAQSTNGDGTDSWAYPKCKVDGAINFNLSRDQVTDIDFEFATFQDDTYVCQDGTIGADYEDLFSATNTTTLHS